MAVSVAPDADAPTLTVADVSGTEDTDIPLNIAAGLTDTDGSETLSVTIAGVPTGATLSAGTDNGDGTWTLSGGDLDGLTITPPANSDVDFTLSVTATTTDGTDTATTTGTMAVSVAPDADAPTLTVADVSGTEDTAIPLNIAAGLTDTDGSETLSVTIAGVPTGATLSAGTDNGDGTWTLSGGDLDGLTITPPLDSNEDFTLTVTATSQDGDDVATTTGTMAVSVAPDADAPTLTVADVSGTEDTDIPLNIAAGLTDTDGSETLSVTIAGVPTGATLSAGTDNGDGTWTLSGGDLDGLTITPPANSDVDFTLSVTATTTDGTDTATTTGTMAVSVAPDADAPTLTVADVSGTEDTAIPLNIAAGLTDTDGSETLSVTIAGVPTGATLSAGTDNGDGTWTLSGGDLDGLTITPPANSDVDFTLSVTATTTDGTDTATTTGTMAVSVAPDADAPTLTVADVSGTEDTAIPLNIAAGLTDTDGSETLSVTIAGVPTGATLSAGTDNGDGTWTLSGGDLDGLTITPPANSDVDFTLSVTATTTDGTDTATTTGTMAVSVAPDADAPTLTVADVSGTEDTAIPLNIAAGLTDTDGSETLSVTIAGVPTGATLSAGTDNGDGTWTLSGGDLDGLTITPPANSDVDFTLSVTATTTDGTDTATTTGTMAVSVAPDADAPTLTVADVSGTEDTDIPLNIAAGLTDTDGSETLSVTIAGVPTGATLSAGTDNGDGTWTLSGGDLDGLTITPPANSDVDFTLSVTATTTDGTDTATTTGTMAVSVAPDADAPTLTVADVSGTEDTAIPLNIAAGLTDTDGSETLSVTIAGVPTGATLSAGTDNGDGTWTLSGGDLDGLTITPPLDSNEDFTLTVTATSQDGDDVATTTGTMAVSVAPDADAPTLTVADVSGTEDTDIPLNIAAGLTDTDGSETLSVTIAGVPTGATLSAGTDNGDGTWTLSGGDLDGLTITPPANSDVDFTLSVTATTTDGTDTATTTGTMAVSVAPDADAPTLTVADVSGTEDTAIPLNIAAGLTDTDGSETLSVTIAGVPTGATLSAGTDNGDGTWTLSGGDLDGLTITPPANSDVDFTLSVTATTTDGTDTATTTGTMAVSVAPDADAPTLTVADVSGTEDTAIPLNIAAGLTDTDGSETLSVTIAGVPTGATLSAGTDNGDGTWTLSGGDLDGLTITPPANSDVDFTLSVTATTTDGTDTATTTGTMAVSVAPDADAPTLTVADVSGTEDTAIPLNIAAGLTDTDGSETLSVTIAGVPTGATLSAGTDNGDGTWTLSGGDLDGLTITPPANSDVDFTLSVTATTTDGTDTATTTGTMAVSVAPDADAPTLTVADVSGTEDTDIPLNIAAGLTDTDGSETLSVTIAGVPTGATLSAGTDNGDGTWTLSGGDLDGLTITPPANSDVDFTLSVTATTTDGTDTATTTGTMAVSVAPDADAPTLTVADVSGTEDTDIPLNIAAGLTDTDGSETLSVTIAGVPTGATLSAGTDNGDGTWTLSGGDLDGLTITPPANSDVDFTLSVTATTTDGTDTATTTGTMAVSVAPDADAPTLTVADVSGTEDTAIPLNIAAGLTDTDGSETLSVTIAGVPTGATLSAGTDNGDGTWTLSGGDLDGLTITPPLDSNEDFTLTVTATSQDGDDVATTTGTMAVSVAPDADAPTLTVADVSGTEDTAIPLNIAAGLTDTDGSETLSVTIAGVPTGATLSAGTDNGDGTWTLSGGDLDGLTITPPLDSNEDFTLTVTATSQDGDDVATTTGTMAVSVAPDADAPTLTVADVSGTEDTDIPLNIAAGLTDTDGSETLSVTIAGVPTGATLSAGTDNGDGTWTLSGGDLEGLSLTPAADSDADFTLSVTATSTDGTDTATTTGTMAVSVAPDADAPTLTVADVSGTEDTAIPLNIAAGLTDLDGSETLSVTIAGVPEGATLSAGTDNGDGTWTLSGGDLEGLSLTPAADSDADFTLSVTATSTDGTDTATTTGTMAVSVAPDADAPTLTVSDVSGTEDTAIPLNIAAGLTDLDGSETLSVTIAGVPTGATLSAGTDNGDGTWTLSGGDLDGLTITPPANSDVDFTLSVTATTTDGTDTATTTGTMAVSVAPDADAPTLTVADVSGTEDTDIPLNIAAGLTDTDGSETLSVTIAGVPTGATLSAGTDNGDGTWTLSGGDLEGLSLTPAADSDADFTLSVTATSTDGTDTATTTGTMAVSVAPDADAPTLTVADVSGTEDTAIPLNIAAGLTDLDGSETLSVTIAGVPEGATLSAGTDNGDGTWTLSGGDLDGLTITPPANSDVDFTLSVTATTTDGTDTATTTGTMAVSVAPDADAPTLTVSDVSGTEDTAIPLNIAAGLTDLDGSETLSVTIAGVPTGATLSAGTDNGDGTWTLSGGDLDGLTITPPANSDVDFTLSVTATTTDGTDTATTTGTMAVSVAPDADAPTLTVADVSGTEDTAIPLNIAAGLTDTDGSETLSVTIAGVPTGATLSAGTDNGDGTWTLSGGDLDGLTITPPANSDVDFTLSVTATTTDGTDTATTTGTMAVSVAPDADAPTLTVADVSGTEDTAIPLNIAAGLTDLDGSETLSVTIAGVPEGATLSAGTDNGDGTWTLSGGDLEGLSLTPAADSDSDFTLTVTATSTDGTDTATTTGTMAVSVAPDADAPTLTVADVSGTEDTAIPLNIAAGLTDLDGSETLSVTIAGVPAGATLSAGTDNGDGTWTLSGGDLEDLSITPPLDSNEDFTLTVTATSQDGDDVATTTGTMAVSVAPDADAPTLSVSAASGAEDTAIALDIAASMPEGTGETISSIVISGVPDGATLSAGTDNGDGTYTVTADQLEGLTITPPLDSNEDFALTVTATSTDGTVTTADVAVAVAAVNDAPVVGDAVTFSMNEDGTITISEAELLENASDVDGDELSVENLAVSNGELTDNGDGTWTFAPDADFNGNVDLTYDVSDGTVSVPTTASIDVGADGEAVNVTFTVNNDGVPAADLGEPSDFGVAENVEYDGADIEMTYDNADSATVSVIDDWGSVSTIEATSENAADVVLQNFVETDVTLGGGGDSTVEIDGAQRGDIETGSGDDTVTIDARSGADDEGGDFTVSTGAGDDTITIEGDYDTSTLEGGRGDDTITGGAGEDTISGGQGDDVLDGGAGNDTLEGGQGDDTFVAGEGDDTIIGGSGEDTIVMSGDFLDYTVSVDQEAGTITLSGPDGTDVISGIESVSFANGTVPSSVLGVAPSVTVGMSEGDEDTAIDLDISVSSVNPLDPVSTVTISGIPEGAVLSAGTDTIVDAGDGTFSVTLTPDQLEGLTLTPPADYSGEIALEVTADTGSGLESAPTPMDVDINPDADAPTLTVADVSGTEDTAIPLNIAAGLTDLDGSETLSVTISGVPTGATLSAGTDNGDGTWTLSGGDLEGLSLTPAADSDADFTLSVTATSTDGTDTATTTGTMTVSVAPDADAPTLTVADVSGTEDTAIPLNIAAGLTDLTARRRCR